MAHKSSRLFIKVHNGFPEHPKTGDLSDRAFRNLIELWCYCSRNLTDGMVSNAQANRILSPKSRRELVVAGFMAERPDGVEMCNYLEHQQSAQEVADLREHRAMAGSKGGKAKANRVANAKQTAKQTPSKSVADTDTDVDPDELANASSVVGTAVALHDAMRQDVEQVCEHLAGAIEANGSKRPVVTAKWRTAARLMLDKDGRGIEEIHGAIEWCQRDEFWRANVMSLPTLREKFDQLRLQAQRQPKGIANRSEEWKSMQQRQMERAIERERQMGIS